ncbi:MAG: DUF2911 domain-containing protein [Ferruginibacter sp.]
MAGCVNKEYEAINPSAKNSDSLSLLFGKNPYSSIDQSPMDVSYYPEGYPQIKMALPQQTAGPIVRVIYSRPHKKGRIIFSNLENSLCKYEQPWRFGANESTEIEFYEPVVINNKNLAAGRYVLYCIPYEDKWVLAVNSNLHSWGLHIDSTQDVVRIELPVQEQKPVLEDFTMVFKPAFYGANLIIAWDNIKVLLPIYFSKS